MAGLQTKFCVEIRVPLIDSDEEKFGSGYTLGPNWVLTAYHVLFDEEVDDSKSIQIIWWDESEEAMKGGEPISVSRENIVWHHRGHDIALINCDEIPYDDIPTAWALVGTKRPIKREPCDSAGFLSRLYDTKGNNRRQTPSGKLGLFSPEAKEVHINRLDVELKKDKYWAGFSGSPVFVDGKLEAVVRTVRTEENKGSLTASFISAALDTEGEGPDQPALREHFGLDKRKTYEEQVEEDIKGLLCSSEAESATKSLAKQLDIVWKSPGVTGEDVTRHLLSSLLESFVSTVDSAHHELNAAKDAAGLSIINEIVQNILPFLFNPHCVEELQRCKTDTAVSLVALPAFSRTVAEVIMAGVDRRATCYRPLSHDEDWSGMEGISSLPQLPEVGRDHSGKQSERDFRTQLYDTFEADAGNEFLNIFNEYMQLRFVVGKDRERVLQQKENIIDQYIGIKLRRDAEKNNLTYYFLINSAEEMDKKTAQQKAIASLKEKYPFIVFLELSNDPKHLLAEAETYLSLPDLIT